MANAQSPIRHPPIRDPRNPWLCVRERPINKHACMRQHQAARGILASLGPADTPDRPIENPGSTACGS
eukprot:4334203-Alexandrium_andersonii.AAC.1